MDIEIVRANKEQAKEICNVLRRSITEVCFKDHKNEPIILQEWLANKTEENIRKWIDESSNYTIVAVKAPSEIVGVSMSSQTGEILLNYLLPEFVACGVGKKMLADIEDWARARGLKQLTAVSTLTAYEFYKKNGFNECDSSQRQEGIAMRKILN